MAETVHVPISPVWGTSWRVSTTCALPALSWEIVWRRRHAHNGRARPVRLAANRLSVAGIGPEVTRRRQALRPTCGLDRLTVPDSRWEAEEARATSRSNGFRRGGTVPACAFPGLCNGNLVAASASAIEGGARDRRRVAL